MKWAIAGSVVLLAAVVGLGFIGWQTINDLDAEVASLASEVAAVEAEQSEMQEAQDAANALLAQSITTPEAPNPEVEDALRDLDGLRLDLEELRQEVGTRPLPITAATLWQMVDELYDTLATLVVTPPPVAEAPPPSDEPSAEWCATFQLALENAGNAAARAQGFSGMNFGIYQEYVTAPMEAIGCPPPT